MKAQFNPGWLVSLLNRWAKRSLASESGALGYPAKAAGFSEKTTGGYCHTVPCDFSVTDFKDLDDALQALRTHNLPCFVTLMCYYKPWTIKAAREEGYPVGNSTYYKRLHLAHALVADAMEDKRRVA